MASTDPGVALRHAFSPPPRTLHVGLAVPTDGAVGRWARDLVDDLNAEPALQLSLVRVSGRDADHIPFILRKLRERSADQDPFRRVALTPNLPIVHAKQDLDVLFWLADDPPKPRYEVLPRYGLWFFRFGAGGLVKPYYWRETAEGDPISVVSLQRYTSTSDTAETIGETAAATKKSWYFTANARDPIAMGNAMAVHALLDLASNEKTFVSLAGTGPAIATPQTASPADAARFLVDRLSHSVGVRLHRNESAGREYWFTAIRVKRNGVPFDPEGFRDVPMPAGVQYADPFICEDTGRHWLFAEEIPAYGEKAHLTCVEVIGEDRFGEPIRILQQPNHLSYPFVFQHGGKWFLIPESGAANQVQLYSATRFPTDWKLDAVLVDGFPLCDTTAFELEGTWYFFTTLHERGAETFLFLSDRLDGHWRYHPRNPICSDTRRARGAGALFYRGNTLIRPSQDCAVRYGYSIVLNEITRLTPTEYEERPIETILPTWRVGVLGTHTLNSDSMYEVIDGSRMVKDSA